MQLEIITGRPPRMLPYLEAILESVPEDAVEFARFVTLAKSGSTRSWARLVDQDVAGRIPVSWTKR